MSDLVRLIAEFIQLLWPFRLVRTGERGGYYIGGRFWRDVGPGCWPVIPWFMDVKAYPEVPAIISTPRLDITLKDGTLLSFSVAASVRMADYHLAINTVDSYTETMIELLSAVCADRLAAVETDRLDPERRGRLLPGLPRVVAGAAAGPAALGERGVADFRGRDATGAFHVLHPEPPGVAAAPGCDGTRRVVIRVRH